MSFTEKEKTILLALVRSEMKKGINSSKNISDLYELRYKLNKL